MSEFEQRQSRTQSSHLVGPAKPGRTTPRLVHAANPVLAQQPALGNQARQRLAQSCPLRLPSPSLCPFGGVCHACPVRVQTKLRVGQPGEQYEREADRVAEQVMRMPEPHTIQRTCPACDEEETLQTKSLVGQTTPLVQRQVESEEEEGEEPIQAKLVDGALVQCQEKEPGGEEEEPIQVKQSDGQAPQVGHSLAAQVRSLRDGGRTLPESVRSFFEPRLGYGFSRARVHTGFQASKVARALNARAFTMGRDIVFGAGQYAPGTATGKRLLAHELTHVVQQRGSAQSRHATSPLIQLQPAGCNAATTGVAPPRNPRQEVIGAHSVALTWARTARQQVERVRTGLHVPILVRTALNHHFSAPTGANLTTIRNRFDGIIRRLTRGTRIYRCNTAGSDPCRHCDQPHPGNFQACSYCPSTAELTRLCPPFFQVSATQRSLILVHEAAHAAGACGDVYPGAGYPGASPVNNAESYARFARSARVALPPPPLRPHVPTAPP